MLDVGCTFVGADLIEQRADAFPDSVSRTLVGFSKQRFELGEGLLDRIEVGAVGWQQEAMGAGVSNGATDGLACVAAQIVEHDDVAGEQDRDEELGHPGEEDRPVDRAIDDAGSDDPLDAQSGQERHRRPAAVRDTPDQALTARCAAMGAGHVGLRPGLVDEDQAFRIDAPLIASPSGALASDVGSLLRGGAQGFF